MSKNCKVRFSKLGFEFKVLLLLVFFCFFFDIPLHRSGIRFPYGPTRTQMSLVTLLPNMKELRVPLDKLSTLSTTSLVHAYTCARTREREKRHESLRRAQSVDSDVISSESTLLYEE